MAQQVERTMIANDEESIAHLVTVAAYEGQCLILLYRNQRDEVKGRATWPVIRRDMGRAVWVGGDGQWLFAGHDSLRDAVVTYRVDRVVNAHLLNA